MTTKRPYKPRDRAATSRIMSSVKSTDSRAELTLRRELRRRGLRYRLHVRDLFGTPDILFRTHRVCVFVDGDFWRARVFVDQGLRALRRSLRSPNRAWWVAKLLRNVARDRLVTTFLQSEHWFVLRFWESEILCDPRPAARKVERTLSKRRPLINRK